MLNLHIRLENIITVNDLKFILIALKLKKAQLLSHPKDKENVFRYFCSIIQERKTLF